MEFKEQKPRIVAVLHSVFATPKYAVSTSFSEQLLLYYALHLRCGDGLGLLHQMSCLREGHWRNLLQHLLSKFIV